MATELAAPAFAEAIGVKVEQLVALERAGLPFVTKAKGAHAYPLPAALRWYVEHATTTRPGKVPARINQKDLAELVDYSPRSLSNLADEKKLTSLIENGKRVYPLPRAVHDVIKHREEVARGRSGDEEESAVDAAKRRKTEAEADLKELELLKKRGELIDRALAASAIGDLLAGLKAQLVQFAPRHEADFVGLETRTQVRAALKAAVHAEIVRLSAAAVQVGRRIQMIEATAESDTEREEGDDAGDAS